mgnify:CR=1 FL=1
MAESYNIPYSGHRTLFQRFTCTCFFLLVRQRLNTSLVPHHRTRRSKLLASSQPEGWVTCIMIMSSWKSGSQRWRSYRTYLRSTWSTFQVGGRMDPRGGAHTGYTWVPRGPSPGTYNMVGTRTVSQLPFLLSLMYHMQSSYIIIIHVYRSTYNSHMLFVYLTYHSSHAFHMLDITSHNTCHHISMSKVIIFITYEHSWDIILHFEALFT